MSNAIVGSIVDVYPEGSPTFRACVIGRSVHQKNVAEYEVINLGSGEAFEVLGGYISDYLIRDINELDKN